MRLTRCQKAALSYLGQGNTLRTSMTPQTFANCTFTRRSCWSLWKRGLATADNGIFRLTPSGQVALSKL
jgi:hypothetical protein